MRFASLARVALVVTMSLCAAAYAQTLYKLIDKNGKITYSESKPKEFDGQVIPLNIDPTANTAVLPKYEASKAPAGAGLTPEQMANVQRAQEKLAAAKRELGAAKPSPETQRVGKVGGGAREIVSAEYEERVSKLEQRVKDAEEEVRNALPRPR